MALIPIVLFSTIAGTWVWLFIESHALFYAFRDRYREEAERKIRYAFVPMAHPSKILYFLSTDSKRFLKDQNDRALLAKRKKVVRLVAAACIVPVSEMAVLAAFVFLFTDI